jgi:hypothetical protein
LNGLLKYSTIVLVVLVITSIIPAVVIPIQLEGFYSFRGLAYLSGLLALYLILLSGGMMLFKKELLGLTRSPEGLRLVHVVISALGGVFLVFHVTLLLFFPMTLPVLFGYLASGAALVVWITGIVILAKRHASLFYHALFSVVGVVLIVVHAFGAGFYRNLQVSALALVLTAFVMFMSIRPNIRLYFRRSGFRRAVRGRTSEPARSHRLPWTNPMDRKLTMFRMNLLVLRYSPISAESLPREL